MSSRKLLISFSLLILSATLAIAQDQTPPEFKFPGAKRFHPGREGSDSSGSGSGVANAESEHPKPCASDSGEPDSRVDPDGSDFAAGEHTSYGAAAGWAEPDAEPRLHLA